MVERLNLPVFSPYQTSMEPVLQGVGFSRGLVQASGDSFQSNNPSGLPIPLVRQLEALHKRCAGLGYAGEANLLAVLLSNKRVVVQDARGVAATLMNVMAVDDPASRQHSQRVMAYASLLGEQLALPADARDNLVLAAVLHDIGKIGVPKAILNKPGAFTREERLQMEQHAVYGYKLLQKIGFSGHLFNLAEVAGSHHERFDGGGYFRGLSGRQIPLGARIIAVADVFDAITSTRSYRKPMSFLQALHEIRQGAGSQFDPAVVEAFFRLPLAALGQIMAQEPVDGWRAQQATQLLALVPSGITVADYYRMGGMAYPGAYQAAGIQAFNMAYALIKQPPTGIGVHYPYYSNRNVYAPPFQPVGIYGV